MQIIFWLGVIATLPALYRFVYACSSIIWRKLFPIKTIEIQILDEDKTLIESLTLELNPHDSKRIIDLMDAGMRKGVCKK